MPLWKRILLRAAGFGAGAAISATLIFAVFFWYKTRPVKPKPWNPNAIKATFYSVSASDESDSKLDFEYVLENETDIDYSLEASSAFKIAAKIQDTNSLTGFANKDEFELKLPVFVPAHQKVRINIMLPSYGFSSRIHLTDASTKEERKKYFADVAAHVTNKMSNLNGFVLFDEEHRYQIELPNGWKERTETNERKDADQQPVESRKR